MTCKRLVTMFLAVLLLVGGCMKVGPRFVKPEAQVNPAWLEAGAYKQLTAKSGDYRDWWRAFNDPALNKLIDTAYRQNLPLQIAGVRVLGARAQLGVAVGSLYPQTQQATGAAEKIRLSQATPEGAGGQPNNYWRSQLGLAASWELDFWGKFRRAVESADASLFATVSDYDNVLVSLTGDVATTYIVLRTLEKRLRIAHENVAVQRESLRIAQARFEGGTTSMRDVEQALTVLESTEATIPTLTSLVRQAKNALSVLLGMPPSDLGDLLGKESAIPAPPPQVAVGIPADLLRRRPDIQSAEWRAAAQCALIGVAKADLFPAFSLNGSFGLEATNAGNVTLGDMFQWRSRTASFGPSFTWNIFNYGRIINQVRVQDARFQELILTYRNTVLQAQQEVENALIAFVMFQQRAEKLAGATAAAQRSLELAILQYREGITDFTTVLTAQQDLLRQQDNLATTLGDISNNLVNMYRAMGGGWQTRLDKPFVPDSVQQTMAARTNWGKLLTPVSFDPGTQQPPKMKIRPPQW
jgi:NodT family efflux transporter outer membrane factor (OMF) lipoprotein